MAVSKEEDLYDVTVTMIIIDVYEISMEEEADEEEACRRKKCTALLDQVREHTHAVTLGIVYMA